MHKGSTHAARHAMWWAWSLGAPMGFLPLSSATCPSRSFRQLPLTQDITSKWLPSFIICLATCLHSCILIQTLLQFNLLFTAPLPHFGRSWRVVSGCIIICSHFTFVYHLMIFIIHHCFCLHLVTCVCFIIIFPKTKLYKAKYSFSLFSIVFYVQKII